VGFLFYLHFSLVLIVIKFWVSQDFNKKKNLHFYSAQGNWLQRYLGKYGVSQEGCARLREGVPYVKVC
jgi:hypothetical protein